MGDAIIGYGEIRSIYELDELSEEEKRECEKWGWKIAIEFEYVVRLDKALLVRDTILKESKLRGRSLHAFPLNKEQVNAIIAQAERLQLQ